jgi:hypothetical protein
VRVIDYCLDSVADAEPIYRLVTTILDHNKTLAAQLAVLCHERWEIETALDELKTHLRGAKSSKTPDLVRQEFYGLLMADFAIRGLIDEAALKADEDPDRLSFLLAVPRHPPQAPAFRGHSPLGRGAPFMTPCSTNPPETRRLQSQPTQSSRSQTPGARFRARINRATTLVLGRPEDPNP